MTTQQELEDSPLIPRTMSALLRLAVKDAQACEADPEHFKLDMYQWVRPSGKICEVCLAGSVLAQTCGVREEVGFFSTIEKESGISAPVFKVPIWADAIDDMRCGNLVCAAGRLMIALALNSEQYAMCHKAGDQIALHPEYADGRAPWETYLKAADMLEAVEL